MKKGLPGKYIKKYGFKEGWKHYKKDKGVAGECSKRTSGKRKKRITILNVKELNTMGKKRTHKKRIAHVVYGKRRTRHARRRVTTMGRSRRRVGMLPGGALPAIINGVMVGGSAIASTYAVNAIPGIKDQKTWIKALTQAGLGLAGVLLIRNPMIKKLSAGFIAGGAITAILPYLPETFQVSAFKGAARLPHSFSPSQLAELRTLGRPVNSAATMGKPVQSFGSSPYTGPRRYLRNY